MKEIKYDLQPRLYTGVITDISDMAVVIEMNGRLGRLSLSRRMIISDDEIKLGDEVSFMLSYPEVIQKRSGGNMI
ncbi:hypothetical protein E8P77_07770 [Soehngenia saccharolytica]|nr:hypothetical protein E8P77_07770 [Soehngenia saccharolytica]